MMRVRFPLYAPISFYPPQEIVPVLKSQLIENEALGGEFCCIWRLVMFSVNRSLKSSITNALPVTFILRSYHEKILLSLSVLLFSANLSAAPTIAVKR